MSDLKDFVGGLLRHPIDTLTGHLDPPNMPAGYTYKEAPHAPASKSSSLGDVSPNPVTQRKAYLDQQIEDASK